MKKTNKFILALGAAACCLGLTACGELTKLQSYEEKGYVVSVTYDANGGMFDYASKLSIMDLYKPSEYEPDANGMVHIKLTEPEDPVRTQPGKEDITLTNSDHFLIGWYQKRDLKLVNGYPVDETGTLLYEYDAEEEIYYYVMVGADGLPIESVRTKTVKDKKTGNEQYFDADGYVLLKDKDGKYIRLGKIDEDKKVIEGRMLSGGFAEPGLPAYTYSELWDFENDTLDYNAKSDKKKALTLYAGWAQQFEFNYYYRVQGQQEWIKHETKYTFDYKTANENEAYNDLDTIFLPKWEGGKMLHASSYKSGETYNFPSVVGCTFLAAYTDSECKNKIENSFEHQGTLDLQTGEAVNRVQNIYFEVEPVERYKIYTAEQFVQNVNVKGHYEIYGDLDFTNMSWPDRFMKGTFSGQIYAANGQTVKFLNVKGVYAEEDSVQGGLFGRLASEAVIKNIRFENVQLDLQVINKIKQANFGLFAGTIAEETKIENVSVSGLLRIGNIERANANYQINLLANGSIDALKDSLSKISLQIYGEEKRGAYIYAVDPQTLATSVIANTQTGDIKLTLKESESKDYQPSYDIIKIEDGGNQQ